MLRKSTPVLQICDTRWHSSGANQMTEHTFIRNVHNRLKRVAPGLYIWKINDTYQGGVADAYYSGGSDLWVEYKFLKNLPKRASTVIDIGLSALQRKWLSDRHREGRKVCVVVGSPDGSLILPGTNWDRSITIADFVSSGVDISEVVAYIQSQTLVHPVD